MPVASAPSPAYGRQNNFDLLRLIAAWLVIITHGYALTGQSVDLDPLARLTARHLHLSNLAVRTFFIISGYLIAASALRSPSLGVFTRNRFLRLWPGLAVCITLTVIVLGPAFTSFSLHDYWAAPKTWHYFRYLLIAKLPLSLPGVFKTHPSATINGSLWTLQYEVACYIIVAGMLVMGWMRKKGPTLILGGVWLAVFAHMRLFGYSDRIKFALIYTHFQTDEFVYFSGYFIAGMVAFFLVRDGFRLKAWMGWASAAALLFWFWVGEWAYHSDHNIFSFLLHSSWPFDYVLLPIIVFCLAFAPAPDWLRHPLGPGRDWSYGIYIYGMPVQQIVYELSSGQWPFWLYQTTCLLAVLPLAAASWALIEGPALRLKGGKKSVA